MMHHVLLFPCYLECESPIDFAYTSHNMSFFSNLMNKGSQWLQNEAQPQHNEDYLEFDRQWKQLDNWISGDKKCMLLAVLRLWYIHACIHRLAKMKITTATYSQYITFLTDVLIKEDNRMRKDETGPCVELLLQSNAFSKIVSVVMNDVRVVVHVMVMNRHHKVPERYHWNSLE